MRKIIKNLFYFIIGLIPKNKNKIVFESSPDFSDSSKVLYDYLIKNRPNKYKYIWLVNEPEKFNSEKNLIYLDINKPYSIKYIYNIASSKHLFFCNQEIRWVNLNKQNVVSLTHGIPIKSCKGKFPKETTFNYLVATSKKELPIIASEYCCDESKCFIADLPRNDLLFQKNAEAEKLVKKYNKVIVWLPTYRKHKNVDILDSVNENVIPLLNEEDLNKLNKKLEKNNNLLILKFHPAEDLSKLKKISFTNILILSQEEFSKMNIHLYSLLAYSDGLITDYSSVSLDYILKNKPIAYIIDDLDEYKSNRGFCIENINDIIAGPKIKKSSELMKFIDDVTNNKDEYEQDRKRVLEFYHKYKKTDICKLFTDKFKL